MLTAHVPVRAKSGNGSHHNRGVEPRFAIPSIHPGLDFTLSSDRKLIPAFFLRFGINPTSGMAQPSEVYRQMVGLPKGPDVLVRKGPWALLGLFAKGWRTAANCLIGFVPKRISGLLG
jgi:hypothetical protein